MVIEVLPEHKLNHWLVQFSDNDNVSDEDIKSTF